MLLDVRPPKNNPQFINLTITLFQSHLNTNQILAIQNGVSKLNFKVYGVLHKNAFWAKCDTRKM